ncbi:MAG: molybdenum cofactor guanylyltransferase [Planctomycetales bacterium]|nr:molybdenum cofactor guanylyltransferase [Planctomycetales bacterium]
MIIGGIIICGGHSTRMGVDKATLPFGDEPLLARVVRLLREGLHAAADSGAPQLTVVAAAQQSLPQLPPDVRVVFDERPDRGPLEGLRAGLASLQGAADAAFVVGCDAPLLAPGLVAHLAAQLGEWEIVAPRDDAALQPLAAVYCASVLPHVEALLAEDRRSLQALLARCRTREIPVDELRAVDPRLGSFVACNTPESYRAALAAAGLAATPGAVSCEPPRRPLE